MKRMLLRFPSLLITESMALNVIHGWSRNEFLSSAASSLFFSAPPVERVRSVDAGGGVDLMAEPKLDKYPDVLFPSSMEGLWTCQRSVTTFEGDSFMGVTAWKALGGTNKSSQLQTFKEEYASRFIPSNVVDSSYMVLDRGFEMASRTGVQNLIWDVREPNRLSYYRDNNNKIQIDVIQRLVEAPSDAGFGFQELYRIFDGPFVRAALVKRRYRRAFDEQNRRQVQGLEIMKTFRVLDGMAGTEFPTATIKTSILMTRARGDNYDVPSAAF
eukprot:CAMPEP_0178937652 /NCGR_PEP_ID=MMETSP0786-20121207/25888_1 /TAXON_ID=186022 /ORGANISM="Thalassionema frauenfeldii, Strain CCMP 1798" /LENGTH=270 /DNA_ID=CAMNT_0020616271 /DNA_START=40 /DNA_END=852 /DNA_ORIENTATION=+